MASAVGGAGGRALEAAAGLAAAVEDQMVRSPAASNLPMAPAASAGLAGEGVGAAVAEVEAAAVEAAESPEVHLLSDSTSAF